MSRVVSYDRGMTLIKKYVIDYVDGMIESGHDGDVEDIIIEGFELRYIELKPRTLINYFNLFAHTIDATYETANISLGYNRFLLRMMSKGVFNYSDIKLLTLNYGFNKYALETYTSLSDEEIERIMLYVQEYRNRNAEMFTREKRGPNSFL